MAANGLAELVEKGEPFYCHQGMRKIVKWQHPVGAEVDGHPAELRPTYRRRTHGAVRTDEGGRQPWRHLRRMVGEVRAEP